MSEPNLVNAPFEHAPRASGSLNVQQAFNNPIWRWGLSRGSSGYPVWGLWGGFVVVVGGAVRASAGFATVVSLICGGWVPLDLCSSHGPLSTIERGRVGLLRVVSRTLCARVPGGPGRLANHKRVVGGVGVGLGERGDLPAEAGEFAGDRDRDHAVGFAAGVFELAPAGVEPALRAPGEVDDLGRVAALAAL